MPYVPTEKTYREQAQQWFQQHPEYVEQLKASGVIGDEADLYDPRTAREASKEFGDNSILAPVFLQPLQDKKRKYYKKHPEIDPQSTMSKVMAFLGLDEPYVHDSRSLDYNQQAFDESLKEGNPDLRFLPPFTDATQEVAEGSMVNNFGEEDPRTDEQKWEGKILDMLNFPMLGMEDEALAAVDSWGGDGTYEDNLKYNRAVQDAERSWTPRWNQNVNMGLSLGLDAPILTGIAGLAGRGINGIRKAAGLGKAGKFAQRAQDTAATSAGFAADDSLWQLGSARGNLNERADQFNPMYTAAAATFPLYMGAGGLLAEGGRKAMEGGKKLASRLKPGDLRAATSRTPKVTVGVDEMPPPLPRRPLPPRSPEPKLPPRFDPNDIRNDLERAIRASKARDRG